MLCLPNTNKYMRTVSFEWANKAYSGIRVLDGPNNRDILVSKYLTLIPDDLER